MYDVVKSGICTYCGQTHILMEEVDSEEEANRQAERQCDCPAGHAARRKMRQQEIISEMFGEFGEEVVDYLLETAELMRNELIESGTTVKLGDGIGAKFKMKDGVVVVTRSAKKEVQRSI